MNTHHCQLFGTSHTHETNQRIKDAQNLAKSKGMRFTPLRESVYRLIVNADKPVGAYDLMHALQHEADKAGDNTKTIAPPTIYRSLEFLVSLGLVHQLNSLNAFVPCCHPASSHVAGFLICQNCQSVEEIQSLPIDEILAFSQKTANFTVKKSTIELQGICHACQ